MRVPLEILRSILEQVQTITTRIELLHLRLVNSTFDQEILSLLFTDTDQLPHIPSAFHDEDTLSHRYWRWVNYTDRTRRGDLAFRFINSANWMTVPPSLQRKYLRFRLTRYGDQQSLFAGLFIGVRELVSSTHVVEEEGDALTELLLSLCAFDTKTSWVAAHHAPNLFKVLGHLHSLSSTRPQRSDRTLQDDANHKDDDEPPNQDPHFQTWTSQISLGHTYILAALPLLHSSPSLLSTFLSENPTFDILSTALPFGASLLTLAIRTASPPLLSHLLSLRPLHKHPSRTGSLISSTPHAPPLARHTPFSLLHLAALRPSPPTETHSILSILYTEFTRIRILSRKSLPEKLLAKAIWMDVPVLVDFLVTKVERGEWVRGLEARMEEVLGVGGFGEPRGYRRGVGGVRLGTGWEKWDAGAWERRREGMRRSLGVVRGRFGLRGEGGVQ